MKLLEGTIGENLCDLELAKISWDTKKYKLETKKDKILIKT